MTLKFDRRTLVRSVSAIAGSLSLAVMAGSAAQAQDSIDVAAIYTLPVEQQWISRIHIALQAADERGDINYVYSENVSNTDYERVMREYAEQGVALMVGEVFGVERAAREVAAEYPEIAFLMGSSFEPSEPNFSVFDNFIHEPSYLTGLVAGSLSESGKIGMVGGYPIPEVNRLMQAFMAGARDVNPDVEFAVTFIGSWYDPPAAKEAAFAMVDSGADVLYAERFGVSDAAVERDVKAIGNVIDTQADYPGTVVASALWHMEPSIDKVIAEVKAGTFSPADYGVYSYMEHGGGSLAPMDSALVSQEILDLVAEKEADILSGALVVEVNNDEPKSN